MSHHAINTSPHVASHCPSFASNCVTLQPTRLAALHFLCYTIERHRGRESFREYANNALIMVQSRSIIPNIPGLHTHLVTVLEFVFIVLDSFTSIGIVQQSIGTITVKSTHLNPTNFLYVLWKYGLYIRNEMLGDCKRNLIYRYIFTT